MPLFCIWVPTVCRLFRMRNSRHTFGTRLADAGVDVVKIKELMGHASIVTTMRYIHATDQGKRGAVTGTPAGYGSYDLLTLVTGCSRQRVQLLISINASLSVFWSQVGHNQFLVSRGKTSFIRWRISDHSLVQDDHCVSTDLKVVSSVLHLIQLRITKTYLPTFQPSKQATFLLGTLTYP